MPFSTQLHAATVTLLLGTGCAAKAPPVKSTDEVVAEARTVMDGHMRDQNAFDAPGITERYHSGGTWWLGDGKKEFLSHDSVGKWYAAGAKAAPPVEFEWQDLSFEPVGPDAVVVTGFYVWRMKDRSDGDTLSYTALLLRDNGTLKIRVENESSSRPAPKQ